MKKRNWSLIDKLRLDALKKILKKVNSFADEMAKLSDEELKLKTPYFKNRLANGETLDDILPEAFATVREVDKRLLGMYPYDVQVLGAIVLHQGNIAEMKTGEGKTLTATMPLYLNALSGQGAILVTTNDYLALRDYKEMKKVYRFLGLTVSEAVKYGVENDKKVKPIHKRIAYSADIVYTTNSALAFDYLIENLASSKDERYLRDLNYIIIDEVDEVLLDVAQTPLIISGYPRLQSNLYELCNTFYQTLDKDIHYKFNDKKKEAYFQIEGLAMAKKFFELDKLFLAENKELLRHMNLALKANTLFEKGKDYVVDDYKVKLLDRTSGRVMENTKLQLGQHQALEMKENVEITQNMRAMASITYQNFFKLFRKISGMSGTAKVSEKEFISTYNMAVVEIPTNKKNIRIDLPDSVYATLPEKVYASVNMLKEFYKQKRPVLLVSGNVDLSMLYSEILLKEGIPHNVLNAHNVAKEAEIIKNAGQLGAVTVATVIAGRGTDIKLGEGVAELGGLAVIGTERMSSRRMDLQLIGRSGRQGDPGLSKFFVSLEDPLLVKNESLRTKKLYNIYNRNIDFQNPKEITNGKLKRLINSAQRNSDEKTEGSRKMTIEFDESMRLQRKIVYAERDKIINGEVFTESYILGLLKKGISLAVDSFKECDEHQIARYILDNISYDYRNYDYYSSNKKELKEKLFKILMLIIDDKKEILITEANVQEFYRYCMLKAIDISWLEHVDNLEQLKNIVENRSTASKNTLFEFYQEADKSFDEMKKNIIVNLIKNIALSKVKINKKGNFVLTF